MTQPTGQRPAAQNGLHMLTEIGSKERTVEPHLSVPEIGPLFVPSPGKLCFSEAVIAEGNVEDGNSPLI